jgi:hypothetical protein
MTKSAMLPNMFAFKSSVGKLEVLRSDFDSDVLAGLDTSLDWSA